MALEPSLVPILFDKGLEQKTNYKLAVPGSFLTLQNAVRRKASLWEKRYGQSIVGTFTGARSLAQFNDDLVCADGTGVQIYNPTGANFKAATGVATPVAFSRQTAYRTANGAGGQDVAYGGGYTCVVFGDGVQGATMAVVYDTSSGAMVMPPFFLHSISGGMAYPPRVVYVNGFFLVFFDENDGNVRLCRINTSTMTAVSGGPLIAGDGGASMDVLPISSTAVAVVYSNVANGITVTTYDPTIGLGTGSNGLPAPITIGNGATSVAGNALSAFVAFGFIYVFYGGPAVPNALKCTVLSATTLAAQATVTVDASGAVNATPVTACISDSTNHVLTVLYASSPTGIGTFGANVTRATVTWSGGTTFNVAAGGVNAYNATLASRAFQASDGHVYCLYGYAGGGVPSQDCYYLVRVDQIFHSSQMQTGGTVAYAVARLCSGTASAFPVRYDGASTTNKLPAIVQDNQGRFSVALRVATAATATLAGLVGQSNLAYGIDLYYLTVGSMAFTETNLGPSLQFAAGMVSQFDGVYVQELGFHTYPENFTTSTATTGGTLLGNTDYYYRVIWEWIDGQGDIHRSGPSLINHVHTTAGTNTNTVTVNVPPLPFTGKISSTLLQSVRAIFYVGYQGDASVFYRHGGVTFATPQSTGSRLAYTIAGEPDTTSEILYTTGGILENIAPPACNVAHVHKNRLWLGGLEASVIWFSKEYSEGLGIAFNDTLAIPIEDDGGPVTAFASLDEKLIIFKKDRIYYVVGNGPTDDGNNYDYSEPQRIPADTGTVLPNTVVTLPTGVLFKSPKGWYMLTRAFQVEYVGDRVEDFNSLKACSATILSDQNEVRLLHSNGDCLVYNYYFNQWSTFTNYQGYASVVANGGTYYRLGTDGTVWKEVAGQYSDNGAAYSLTVETSWLSLARLQGYQRVYKLQLLSDFVADHTLQVQIAYDFKSTYNQTINFPTTGVISGTTFSLQIQPQIQKCSAIKIKFTDTASTTASLKPTSLAVEVGRKKGAARLPPTQSV